MHKLQIAPIARTALLLCIGVFVLVIVTEQTLGGQQADMHSAYASAQFQVPPPEPTLPPAYEPPNYACGSFYDVIPSDYYYRGVMFMNCRNVVGGYEGGFFRPYNYVTRGQLAKIVTLAHNYDTNYSGGQHFVDVPPTDTFYQYVETAYFHGLMDPRVGSYCPLPTPLCYFHPYANAKRSEAAKAAVVAAGYTLLNPAIGSFTDVPTSHAYYQHIETAFARHILDGYIFGLFLPDGLLTRGQLVKVDTNARFYHQAGQFAQGPYDGSNNWEVADTINNFPPDGIETIPSGQMDGFIDTQYYADATNILFTATAKQWIIDRGTGNFNWTHMGFYTAPWPHPGGCSDVYYGSATQTDLPGAVRHPALLYCNYHWMITKPEGLSITSPGHSMFAEVIPTVNFEYTMAIAAEINQIFTYSDILAHYCFRGYGPMAIVRCPAP